MDLGHGPEFSCYVRGQWLVWLGYAERIPSWVMACREIVESEKAEKEEEYRVPA